MAIDKIKGKKKRADIEAIHNFIVQSNTTNIDKNTIKDFVTQLVAQKLVIKKNMSQRNESYHLIISINHIIKHQQMKIYLNHLNTLQEPLLKIISMKHQK